MFQPVSIYVGLRYSVPRGHGFFVSFITWISLLGVAVGVAAVIIVLSVMNGFESELRSKLLSISAHARLINGGASIPDWKVRLQQLQGAQGLVGAAPILDTDAMLSRQTSMSGAILRGIEPTLESSVLSQKFATLVDRVFPGWSRRWLSTRRANSSCCIE